MDDYECRENANGRMIDHLNKSINLNKGRICTAKKRYIELNTEVTRMNKKENTIKKDGEKDSTKKQKVVGNGEEEETIRYEVLEVVQVKMRNTKMTDLISISSVM